MRSGINENLAKFKRLIKRSDLDVDPVRLSAKDLNDINRSCTSAYTEKCYDLPQERLATLPLWTLKSSFSSVKQHQFRMCPRFHFFHFCYTEQQYLTLKTPPVGNQCTKCNKIMMRFERVPRFWPFMLKISYPGCPYLSPVISVQFTVEVGAADENHEKTLKVCFLDFKVVQGHWRWYCEKTRLQCSLP